MTDKQATEVLSLTEDTTLTDEQTRQLNAGKLRVRLNGYRLMTSPNVPLDFLKGAPLNSFDDGSPGTMSGSVEELTTDVHYRVPASVADSLALSLTAGSLAGKTIRACTVEPDGYLVMEFTDGGEMSFLPMTEVAKLLRGLQYLKSTLLEVQDGLTPNNNCVGYGCCACREKELISEALDRLQQSAGRTVIQDVPEEASSGDSDHNQPPEVLALTCDTTLTDEQSRKANAGELIVETQGYKLTMTGSVSLVPTPCPFCGEAGVSLTVDSDIESVMCDGCKATGPSLLSEQGFETQEEMETAAILAWNNRRSG